MNLLLENGADLHYLYVGYYTLLQVAAWKGKVHITKELVERYKVDVEEKTEIGTAFFLAVWEK